MGCLRISYVKYPIQLRIVRENIWNKSKSYTEAYRFGFNGKEKDNETYGDGNSYDFGARMLDVRLGRWLTIDALAKKYPEMSPFSFSFNTPIQAKDPDGNVIIFINGQHSGGGGTAAYWGGYDSKVKHQVGDWSARYVDGALGGFKNTRAGLLKGAAIGMPVGPFSAVVGAVLMATTSTNISKEVRMAAGAAQGEKDAADIIANLKEGETIKIVSHSMGTAFARGYVDGIMKYAKENGLIKKVNIEYELDVNAFQGGDLPKNPSVGLTQNKTGGLDGGKSLKELATVNSVPSVAPVPDAENITLDEDANNGHAIDKMSYSNIPKLGNGGKPASVEQGNNNQNKPN